MDMSIVIVTIKGFSVTVLPGVFRSVYGWYQASVKDNYFSPFEIRQLKVTVLRSALYGILSYVGFNLSGIDNSEVAAMISAIAADKIIEAIKKNKT